MLVWCARCSVAWRVDTPARIPVTAEGHPIRCPRCQCHRRVARIADEAAFRIARPGVAIPAAPSPSA